MQRQSQLESTSQELQEYKVYLAEAQEEIQQLQVQLVSSKRAAVTSAAAAAALTQQLQEARQLNNNLQQQLSGTACIQQQLYELQQQLTASKQQLIASTEASAAHQQQLQDLESRLQEQQEQHKQQEQLAAQQLATAKAQIASAKAEVRELRRAEAAASQQLSALAADLEAARAAEKAALADARRARAAESSRSKQLAEAEEQLSKCREQLALASDIHSQLSRLQSALHEQKRQQRSSQADAEQNKEQQVALLTELGQYKAMLSEAQEEVARLEGDSRELHALRRRSGASTPVMLNPAQPQTAQGIAEGTHTSHHVVEAHDAGSACSSTVRRISDCSVHQSQQHSAPVCLTEEYACKAAAAQQYSNFKLMTELCIPDTPSRPQSTVGVPSQAAAAASPAALGMTTAVSPGAAGILNMSSRTASTAGALSPRPGWMNSPGMLQSQHSAKNLQAKSTSSSRIPAGPAAKRAPHDGHSPRGHNSAVGPAGNTVSSKAARSGRPSTAPDCKAKSVRMSEAPVVHGSNRIDSNGTSSAAATTVAAGPGGRSAPTSPGISRCGSAATPIARKASNSTAAAVTASSWKS